MASDRAAQEIAIARREATRIAHERNWSRSKRVAMIKLQGLVRDICAKTGLEPVEAAKLSECHELLAEIAG